MAGIDSYSVTPATNATATGGSVNWAEGQAPSTVNNSERQVLTDIREAFNDLAWFTYGTGDQGAGNLAVPGVYASATSFTITGADVHLIYETGRRVRAVGTSTGTIYGAISSSSYNSGNSTTTVNVTWDSGSLSNETLDIRLAQIPVTGKPIPAAAITQPFTSLQLGTGTALTIYQEGTWTPADNSGASLTLTVNKATYVRIGRVVHIYGSITYPSTASAAAASISGLPYNVAAGSTASCALATGATVNVALMQFVAGAAVCNPSNQAGNAGPSNANLSTQTLVFQGSYFAT